MSHKIILTEEQINDIKELSKTLTRKQISQKTNISIAKVNQVFNPSLTKEEFINKYGQEAWNKKQLKKAEYDKKYRQKNKEYRNNKNIEYWSNHREEQRKYRRAYEDKRKKDVNFKLQRILRSRINNAIKAQKTTKDLHMLELLGCTLEQCREYISSKFRDGMSWENHGKLWHIDHIIPCSYFDFNDKNNLKLCFNYRNLQPLLIKENLLKKDSIPLNIESILLEIKSSLPENSCRENF